MDTIALGQALIQCQSVTPEEGGALALLEKILAKAGFTVSRPVFSETGQADVENLYARFGTQEPVFVFAGHTDVVPVGDEAAWLYPPFAGKIDKEILYGRGAVDMKGGVAAMVSAALRFLEKNGGKINGSIVFLITGDEEGPAVNGTKKLLEWAAQKGETFSHCVLGEPTSVETLGDTLKIGRRGSLSGILTVAGVQGHVAYPHRANNPMRIVPKILGSLMQPLDSGTAHFDASNLEIVSIDTGNTAFNVIPASVKIRFNVRYNDNFTIESLQQTLLKRIAPYQENYTLALDFLENASASFITQPGAFISLLAETVNAVTGHTPNLSTGGGTSDARFIKDFCPVVELGLVGTTMHQVDECVPLAELRQVTDLYEEILKRYFAVSMEPSPSK